MGNSQGNFHLSVKIAGRVAGGLYGSALCAQRDYGTHSDHPTVFVGAPGESDHRGAVYLLQLSADGSLQSAIKLAPSTWRDAGPTLDPHDNFGASIAVRRVSVADAYELSVGAPGLEGVSGAVVTFDMGRDFARSHTRLKSLDLGSRAFGTSLAYGGDLDGDGTPELLVGGSRSIVVVFSGSNRTGARRWLRVLESVKYAVSKQHAPVVGARTIALLGNESGPALDMPLMWMARARSRSALHEERLEVPSPSGESSDVATSLRSWLRS